MYWISKHIHCLQVKGASPESTTFLAFLLGPTNNAEATGLQPFFDLLITNSKSWSLWVQTQEAFENSRYRMRESSKITWIKVKLPSEKNIKPTSSYLFGFLYVTSSSHSCLACPRRLCDSPAWWQYSLVAVKERGLKQDLHYDPTRSISQGAAQINL